jgi:D-amino peptidase
MRVVISADMEGTCGVVSWVQVRPPEAAGRPTAPTEYERTRLRMTGEVNAAVEGALAGGATDIVVADGHDLKRNLLPDELHPACRLITGDDRPLGMAQGVDLDGVGCLLYTGYHAKAGTAGAPLAHTSTTWIGNVRLDGVSTGEFGLNAAVAGHYGVPVALVAGDDKAVAQTRALLGADVVGVAVKEGISTFAALHLHPERARELIREAAEVAVRRAAGLSPWRLRPGCRVELAFDHQARADQAVLVPGVERLGPREVAWAAADGRHLILVYRAVLKAAAIPLTA